MDSFLGTFKTLFGLFWASLDLYWTLLRPFEIFFDFLEYLKLLLHLIAFKSYIRHQIVDISLFTKKFPVFNTRCRSIKSLSGKAKSGIFLPNIELKLSVPLSQKQVAAKRRLSTVKKELQKSEFCSTSWKDFAKKWQFWNGPSIVSVQTRQKFKSSQVFPEKRWNRPRLCGKTLNFSPIGPKMQDFKTTSL